MLRSGGVGSPTSGYASEPHAFTRPQLRQDVGVVVRDDGDDGVSAGRGVVREEDQRLARVRYLDGAADDGLTGQFRRSAARVAAVRRAAVRDPVGRTPTRSVSADTVHDWESSVDTADGANQSSRGPTITRTTTSVTGGAVGAATSTSAGAAPPRTAGRTAIRRPGVSGAGPTPMVGSVLALPSTRGSSRPPRTARYVRRPVGGIPRLRSRPSGRSNGASSGAARSSTCSGAGAPVTQTRTVPSARTARPPRSTSSAGAPSALPSSRLASRSARRSAAPLPVTPMDACPGRPRSSTRVSGPTASTTSAVTFRPRRSGPVGRESAVPAGRGRRPTTGHRCGR